MLPSGAIRVGRTRNTAVVFNPAARFARAGAILIPVAFDADHPFRSTNLPPNGTASCALFECDWVGDARGATGTRICAAIRRYVEGKLGIAAAY